ncbi:MAG: glycosyltransferase family 4 protein [candidate division KSB1 bacterium]|nr:glycosyltransferase family 4 protein [candidate division KSB1 bacterium]
MRILMTHWLYPPEFTGAGLQGHRLGKELQRLGCFVRVLSGTHEKGLVGIDEYEGIIVERVLRNRLSPFGRLSYGYALYRAVKEYAPKFEIVHAHGFHPQVNLAASAAKLPLITKLTNQRLDGPAAINRRRFGRLHTSIFNLADAFVATSQDLAEQCLAAGLPEEKIVRIPNGVDTELFRPVTNEEKLRLRQRFHSADDKVILLTVGSVEFRKGLDLLLRALHALEPASRERIRLWVVGPLDAGELAGEMQIGTHLFVQQVRRMIREFGLEDTVRFMGRQQNVHEYMAAADIYVHPSRVEGQPNAVLEAMACGLPVAANRLPGITDEILQNGRYGLLVDAENSALFAAALRVLINNPSLRQRIGSRAVEHIARHFSIESIAQRYVSLYSSLVHKRTFDELRSRKGWSHMPLRAGRL